MKTRTIVSILITLILIAAVGVGIYLVKNPQILKSKAGGGGPIFYVDSSGVKHTDCATAGSCTTSSQQIKITVDSNLLDPNRWTTIGVSPTP